MWDLLPANAATDTLRPLGAGPSRELMEGSR